MVCNVDLLDVHQSPQSLLSKPVLLWNRSQEPDPKSLAAAIYMARHLIAKGDEAYWHNDFALSRESYEAALGKIQNYEDTLRLFWTYHSCYRDATDLRLEILSKLTTASLELSDFENVHRWADTIIALDLRFWDHHKHRDYADWVLYARNEFYTAHYCKAVVYQKQLKFTAAVRNFELALMCSTVCRATYYQLEALKQTQTFEEMKRKAEEERLQQQRETMKKQEEKKARKKMAKKKRIREKRARGVGNILGLRSF